MFLRSNTPVVVQGHDIFSNIKDRGSGKMQFHFCGLFNMFFSWTTGDWKCVYLSHFWLKVNSAGWSSRKCMLSQKDAIAGIVIHRIHGWTSPKFRIHITMILTNDSNARRGRNAHETIRKMWLLKKSGASVPTLLIWTSHHWLRIRTDRTQFVVLFVCSSESESCWSSSKERCAFKIYTL